MVLTLKETIFITLINSLELNLNITHYSFKKACVSNSSIISNLENEDYVIAMRFKDRSSVIGLAVVAGLCTALPARANLITNGDFETGTLSSWTSTGNVGIANLPYFGFNEQTYGSYSAAFNGGDTAPNGTLSQIISTVSGMSYLLEFNYADNAYYNEQSQSITVSAQVGDGQVLSSQSFSRARFARAESKGDSPDAAGSA